MTNPVNVFMMTALHHARRMYHVANMLSQVVRVDRSSVPLTQIPIVLIHHPETIRAWLQCWLLLLKFGRRYRQRLDAVLMLAMLFTVYLLGRFVIITSTTDDTSTLKADVQLYYGVFFLIWWGGIMIATVALTALANERFAKDEVAWLQHRLMLRCPSRRRALARFAQAEWREKHRRAELRAATEGDGAGGPARLSLTGSVAEAANLRDEELDDLMQTTSDTIESGMRLEPLKFLHASASGPLAWSMFTLWISVLAYVTQALTTLDLG